MPSTLGDFQLYNTLSRKKEVLFAQDGQTLRFYCCGPTVYGPAHIGNFRTFVLQDLMRRVAEARGLKTCHVRNITDVDDKTIKGSQAQNIGLDQFTLGWTERFHRDCAALGLLEPHHEPGAVAHIPEQVRLILKLQEKGLAYWALDASVYFRISAFPAYGKLSGLDDEKRSQKKRIENDEYDRRQVGDFALWKAKKVSDGDCYWPSPWGPGRPGWHIECSAMSMTYLGPSFDLHSGGVDLIFPHHENEIAQSEGATGQSFCRHWFHVNHLTVEGQKMSKSLGNLATLEDVEAKGFQPRELRYALLLGHYRKNLNFVWDNLLAARKALERLARVGQLLRVGQTPDQVLEAWSQKEAWGSFLPVAVALLDDLNTPRALAALFQRIKELEEGSAPQEQDALGFQACLWVLGLDLPKGCEFNRRDIPEAVRAWARERQDAKTQKNWALADELREKIHGSGWSVVDRPEGYELVPRFREPEEPQGP